MKSLIINLLCRLFGVYQATKSVANYVSEYVETKGYDHNTCFDIAVKKVLSRPNIFTNRREKLLVYIILRELRRRRVYFREEEDFSVEITRSYLQKGFVYFGDLGLSSDSIFSFLELGRITPGMYQELKNVHTRWRRAFDEGEDRRQELQRQIYDKLMSKRFDFVFASLP